MPEIVGTFLRTELWGEGADGAVKAWDGSRCHFTQECLEFAVRHLDGIEVTVSIARPMPVPRWTRQLSITTMSLRRSVGTKQFSTSARNISPVMAPSTTIGATILL